jgi:hypothetical protein
VSGPLASWVQAHSKAKPAARFVLVTLALRADHEGNGADHSTDQLAELTGHGRATVLRSLAKLYELAELERVKAGGGRGNITRHRIPIRWCPAETGCVLCRQLAKVIDAANGLANGVGVRPFRGQSGRRGRGKGLRESRKGSQSETPYVTKGTGVTGQQRLAAATAGLRNGAGTVPDDQGPENLELGSRTLQLPSTPAAHSDGQPAADNVIDFPQPEQQGGSVAW